MKSEHTPQRSFARAAALLALALGSLAALAQELPPNTEKRPPAPLPGANAAAATPRETNSPSAPLTPTPAVIAPGQDPSQTNAPGADQIQLSFQGANIDMVVQWLAQTTGKSVVKHPQVQCQLTITSSKKLTTRQAIQLVYRALALEGVTALESGNSILITPESKEPKLNPELVDGSGQAIPEGRQRLVKIFTLAHVPAAELREKIRPVLSEKGTCEVDERANQLILTDYNDNVRLVAGLLKDLDTDKPEDVAVRVIQLKNLNAADLVKEIAPLYQKKSGKSPKESVEVAANERSNCLIVLASETNFRAVEKVVSTLDTEDAQEKLMRTFPLKNADAEDVARQLQDLSRSQDNSSSYPYFIFSSSPMNKAQGKKFSVVADRRRNSLVIQAPPAQMDSIEKMIKELDEPITDNSLAPRIYPLKYVSAVDIEDVLNELFLKKNQQRGYWDYFSDYSEANVDRDVGRLYGKIRIASEPYSNCLIVTSNSKESLAVLEDVLKQLDNPSQAGESTLHIPLSFAKAATVANSINILFAKNGSPPMHQSSLPQPANNNAYSQLPSGQQQNGGTQTSFALEQEAKEEGYFPWLGGQPDNPRTANGRNSARPVSDLVGRVRAVADQRSNSLLISANVHYFPQVLKLVEQLDAPTPQVLIEARIVEVSSDFLDKLGVRWSPDGSQVFTADDYDNSLLFKNNGSYRSGFGGTTKVNTPDGGVNSLITSIRSGVVSSTISLDFLVQFLKRTTDAKVLAEPQINIADNEMGKLFVGQQVPFIDKSQTTDVGALNQSFQYKDVGVILEVTPHINTSGDVALKIRAESSSIVPGQTLFGGAIIDTRDFRTDLKAKSGETLVLGGIIQKQISDTLRKTPIMGDIPGLGWAFKKKDKTTREVELMVFLRPKVTRTPEEARQLLEEIYRESPKIKNWKDGVQEDDSAKGHNEKPSH